MIVLALYPSILDYTINAVSTLTVGGNWEQAGVFSARLSLEVFPTRKGQVDSFCPSDQFRWSSPPTTMNRDRLLSLPIQLATSPEPNLVPVPRPAPPPADRFASPRRIDPQSAFTVCLPFVFMVLRIAFPATPFL